MKDEIEKLQTTAEELSKNIEINYESITKDFLESKRGNFVKLLDPEPVNFKLNRNGNDFNFSEPIFIKKISFFSSKENHRPNIKVIITYPGNLTTSELTLSDSKRSKNRNFVSVNNFVKKISITSSKTFEMETLSKVNIQGLSAKDFFILIDTLNSFSNRYEELKKKCTQMVTNINTKNSERQAEDQKFSQKKETLEEKIKKLSSDSEEKKSELKELNTQTEKVKQKLTEIKTQYSDTQEKDTKVSNSVEELTETQSSLNKNISNLKDQVEKLNTRKDLYSENMTGFTSESSKQLNYYYGLLIIVIIAIIVMGIYAILQINDLLTIYEEFKVKKIDITGWDLIIMRVPYASIALATLSALSLFGKTLVSKVFEINSQKRMIISLSILARDITYSSTKNTKFTDSQIVEKRESLKFDLLSESLLKDTFNSIAKNRQKRSKESNTESN